MLGRLGRVLYLAACILAVAVLIFGSLYAFGLFHPDAAPTGRDWLVMAVGGAIAIWLIGRAAKYVLSGQ